MRLLGLLPPAAFACLVLSGCAHSGSAAGQVDQTNPARYRDAIVAPCAYAGTDGADTSSICATSAALLVSPQLQEAVHDLRRLGLANAMREVGRGRVAVVLGETALEQHVPLAYHLERMYRAYRSAYDYGDTVALELWKDGEQVGTYTSQGLLLR